MSGCTCYIQTNYCYIGKLIITKELNRCLFFNIYVYIYIYTPAELSFKFLIFDSHVVVFFHRRSEQASE